MYHGCTLLFFAMVYWALVVCIHYLSGNRMYIFLQWTMEISSVGMLSSGNLLYVAFSYFLVHFDTALYVESTKL